MNVKSRVFAMRQSRHKTRYEKFEFGLGQSLRYLSMEEAHRHFVRRGLLGRTEGTKDGGGINARVRATGRKPAQESGAGGGGDVAEKGGTEGERRAHILHALH